ncbi:protein of unknown function [Bradyrhizobium vignae]|uniref:Uncharacterized protein n=1 Tax=Bradyrhizobium vignae TaxID=1549949 RepID=A0A2U3PR23_9BRAD|nr:protein of unknown function [Bradyrhizobium vignae]
MLRHSGMVRGTRPQVRNCAPGSLKIPGSVLTHRPGMTSGWVIDLVGTPPPEALPYPPRPSQKRDFRARTLP